MAQSKRATTPPLGPRLAGVVVLGTGFVPVGLEALDEHDDVKRVHANFDISEAEMVRMAEAG